MGGQRHALKSSPSFLPLSHLNSNPNFDSRLCYSFLEMMIKYETLISNINPKRLFSSKSNRSSKSKSLSRSDPSSSCSSALSLTSSSSDGSSAHSGMPTPMTVMTVLPDRSSEECPTGLLLHAFKLIDRDGDGKISVSELELIFSRVAGSGPPPSKEDVATMLAELDCDGDGSLSLEEFKAIGSDAFGKPARASELRYAFDFFDVNRDGRITAEELLDGFIKLGDLKCSLNDCRRMIAEVDANKDGFVCFDDFCRMMEHEHKLVA